MDIVVKVDLCRREVITASESTQLTIDNVLRETCRYFRVSEKDICSKSRKQEYVIPRFFYIYFCWRYFNVRNSVITDRINKNNSMVNYARSQVSSYYFRDRYKEFEKTLTGILTMTKKRNLEKYKKERNNLLFKKKQNESIHY